MRVHDLKEGNLDLWVARAAGKSNPQLVDGACVIGGTVPYRPSSAWADGGPIIELEKISVWRYPDLDSWHAALQFDFARDEGLKVRHYYQGPTPLIAAMRCFIASKLGNEVF